MRKQPAQMIVEFALIAPVLVMLALGILGLGRAFYTYLDLTNAARAAARYATAESGMCAAPADFESKVKNIQPNLLPWPPGASISPPERASISSPNDACRVSITYPFDTLIPGSALLPFLGEVTMSTSATMPVICQLQPCQ